MHTHESQAPGFQPQVGSNKPNSLGSRPFEVTFPGQELAAAPTNPFVQRSANSWATPPAAPPPLSPPPSDGETGGTDIELDWRPQFSLYAAGQPTPPPPRPWVLQAKLTIGRPDDPYEQEADRVADQVMALPTPTPQVQRQAETEESDEVQAQPLVETITPLIQRQGGSEDTESIQPKCEACEKEEQVQRSSNTTVQAQPDLESQLQTSQGRGNPLPQNVLSFMEPRFGTDFSQVRVHTDSEAVQMNWGLGAQAFTHQNHIYYGAGKAPANDELTGHELTHVIQQTQSLGPKVQRTEEQRYTGGLRWYIEASPPTPVVLQGTNVTFRIRNNPGLTQDRQQELASEARRDRLSIRSLEAEIPAIDLTDVEWGIIDDSGRSFPWDPGFWNTETEFEHQFNHEGRRTVYFRGTPSSSEHVPHREIYVSYDIEVAHHPNAPVLERTQDLAAHDESVIRDPETRYGELANLFQRIAIRRALHTLSENKREAINLRQQYEQSNALLSNPRATMASRLRPVLRRLIDERNSTRRHMESVPRTIGHGDHHDVIQNPNYARDVAQYREQLNAIQHSIDQIEATYPELASFHRYQESHPTGGGLDFRQTTMVALQGVENDIDSTRNRIITEDLSILDVNSVINPLLRELESSNPNIRVAFEIVQAERTATDLWTELGTAGVSIALLFVPGIGPFLSAGFGLAVDAVRVIASWEEAEDFATAANSGAREGVIVTQEAEARRSEAIWASIAVLAGLADLGFETRETIAVAQAARTAQREVEAAEELAEGLGDATRASDARTGEPVLEAGDIPARRLRGSGEEVELTHPQGRAEITQEQTRLLRESGGDTPRSTLSSAHIEAEKDVVRRSTPQPCAREWLEQGYLEEVDLGNGHHWRRKWDGTWCRFTTPSDCGAVIGPRRRMLPAHAGADLPTGDYEVRFFASYEDLPRDGNGQIANLPEGQVYIFSDGTIVWREGDSIRHDSTVGPSQRQRMGFEHELPPASDLGRPELQGMHRCHALGRGTGFESPFGIAYCPAQVNLLLQNNGIEEYLRGLRDTLPSGENLHINTSHTLHSDGMRLRQARYQVEVERISADGTRRREQLFEYVIDIGDDRSVTHEFSYVTDNPNLQSYMDSAQVDVPERIRHRLASRTSARVNSTDVAENLEEILPFVGRRIDEINPQTLPEPYRIRGQVSGQRLTIERRGICDSGRSCTDDRFFEPLTVDENGVIRLTRGHPTES